MAASTLRFLLVFFTTILCLSSLTLSRTTKPNKPTTTTLDVSSSLQQALSILSHDPKTTLPFAQQQTHKTTPFVKNSSAFSLSLHSRDAIRKTHHKSYESLMLSRLARDESRVAGLIARVRLALEKPELKPETDVELGLVGAEEFTTPVTSGTSQGSGEYFTRVGVGSPAKEVYMVLDTGSDVSWLQCEPCSDCYSQSDPIFDPSGSSSYSAVSCSSSQCNALEMSSCRGDGCLYQVNYGDGSFTFGELASETLSFGKSGAVNNIALGCGHDNEGLFVGAAGLLGLGGGPISLTSQLKTTTFSYCLVNRDSAASSTLDLNAGATGSPVMAPLVRNQKMDTFYYVGLTGMSVGGHMLSIPQSVFQLDESGNGGVIVDCGTAITRLQTQAYQALRDAFVSMTPNLNSTSPVSLFDTCYDLSGQNTVKIPTVSFLFSAGKSWSLPAANYMIPVDSTGTYCFAFAPTTSSLSIIGNVQQQGTRVSFDLAGNRLGFQTNQC